MKPATDSLPEGFFDAHLHLQDPSLQKALIRERERDRERERALPRLRSSRSGPGPGFWEPFIPPIAAQVVNGTHPDDWAAVRALEQRGGTGLLRAYGVHPWRVGDLPDDWERQLREYLDLGAASIGEIGLDHWKEPRDEQRQMDVFERQLQLAHETGLAPTIHCLRAWGLLIDILRAGPALPHGFLVHGFGGSREVLFQLLDLGGHASFSAYASDPGRKRMRDAARACPLDRLLVETDAPDMVPPENVCQFPLRDADGQRLHHPFEIRTAYRFLAKWRGEDPEKLAGQVRENFSRVFGLSDLRPMDGVNRDCE